MPSFSRYESQQLLSSPESSLLLYLIKPNTSVIRVISRKQDWKKECLHLFFVSYIIIPFNSSTLFFRLFFFFFLISFRLFVKENSSCRKLRVDQLLTTSWKYFGISWQMRGVDYISGFQTFSKSEAFYSKEVSGRIQRIATQWEPKALTISCFLFEKP